MSVHFSSATDLWATPAEFFDRLNEIYHFEDVTQQVSA